MTDKLIHEKKFKITSYDSDFKGKVTVQALLHYFQELAWEHAEKLEVGYSDLIPKNLIWVLVRQKIKISEFPKWQEMIKIKTCARGKERLFWYRDFEIFDENDRSIAIATSSWLIIDLKSRRPYKGDDLLNLKLGKGNGFWEESLSKLASPINGKLFFEKEAAYSDLDINNHVNNVKYLEWILDGYDFEFIKNNEIETVELNYIAECSVGDKIQITSEFDENNHLHSITTKENNKELIKTKIVWKDKYN